MVFSLDANDKFELGLASVRTIANVTSPSESLFKNETKAEFAIEYFLPTVPGSAGTERLPRSSEFGNFHGTVAVLNFQSWEVLVAPFSVSAVSLQFASLAP